MPELGAQISFRELLKRYRVAAGLSQEALAERAQLSVRGISDLERGINRAPRAETVMRLASALGLSQAERAALEAAVVRRRDPLARAGAASVLAAPEAAHHAMLPTPTSGLIGREREQRDLARLFQRDDVRLLTLTGPGGVGKTRLALAAAADLSRRFADGVAFVSLAALRDPALVASVIAQALSVREGSGQPLHDTLLAHLAGKQILLVLDNFEQVAAAAPLLADLLASCPQLKLLVTSRAAVHVRGEHEFPVPPLALADQTPAGSGGLSPDELAQVAAVALFMQRARAIAPDLRLTSETAAAVAAICRRLDGLPLAIELAAVWVKLLPPATLLARLERRLPLLTRGASDLPERQQTLRGAIAWSYNLLHAGEQALFRRLAMFAGGCTLEAIETICQTDGDLTGDVLGWLLSLVEKSLMLQLPAPSQEPRFGMLETIREYGLECLAAAGEVERLGERHAAYYLALAERAEPHLSGPEQGLWLDRLEAEHDNLRATLAWCLERAPALDGMPVRISQAEGATPAASAMRLAAALRRFWEKRGHWTEGRHWLRAVLALRDTAPIPLRARVLHGAGVLAYEQGEYSQATTLLGEALAMQRETGDAAGAASSLNDLGRVAIDQAEYQQAVTLFEESLALKRAMGDKVGTAHTLNNLGIVAMMRDDLTGAAALFAETHTVWQEVGDKLNAGYSLLNWAAAVMLVGDPAHAKLLLEQSLPLFQGVNDAWGIAAARQNLGNIACLQGEYERARACYEESLAVYRDLGAKPAIADCLKDLAIVASKQPTVAADRAARLFSAAEALREAIGGSFQPQDRAAYDQAVEAARAALGKDRFTRAWAAGKAMTLEQAIEEALGT